MTEVHDTDQGCLNKEQCPLKKRKSFVSPSINTSGVEDNTLVEEPSIGAITPERKRITKNLILRCNSTVILSSMVLLLSCCLLFLGFVMYVNYAVSTPPFYNQLSSDDVICELVCSHFKNSLMPMNMNPDNIKTVLLEMYRKCCLGK